MSSGSGDTDFAPGLEFYDGASKRQLKYVYSDTQHWTARWA